MADKPVGRTTQCTTARYSGLRPFSFSKVRAAILTQSHSVLQDDSGIPPQGFSEWGMEMLLFWNVFRDARHL